MNEKKPPRPAHWPGPPPKPQFAGVDAFAEAHGRAILAEILAGRTIADALTVSGLPSHEGIVHVTHLVSAILDALDDALADNPPPEPAPPPRRRPA